MYVNQICPYCKESQLEYRLPDDKYETEYLECPKCKSVFAFSQSWETSDD